MGFNSGFKGLNKNVRENKKKLEKILRPEEASRFAHFVDNEKKSWWDRRNYTFCVLQMVALNFQNVCILHSVPRKITISLLKI